MEQHETVQVDKPVALAVAYFQTNSNSACNNQFFSTSSLTFTDAAVEVSDKMVSFFLVDSTLWFFLAHQSVPVPGQPASRSSISSSPASFQPSSPAYHCWWNHVKSLLTGKTMILSSILFLLAPQDSWLVSGPTSGMEPEWSHV